MKRTKKLLLVLPAIIIIILVALVAYINISNEDREDDMNRVKIINMHRYAIDNAIYDDVDGRSSFLAVHPDSKDDYSGIVFVMSAEYRKDFPDDVVVLWPTELTYQFLDAYNRLVLLEEIDLTIFSLEYPLTIENMVYDWEKVFDLLSVGSRFGGFDQNRRVMVRTTAGRWPTAEDVSEESLARQRTRTYAEFFRLNDIDDRPSLRFVLQVEIERFSNVVFVADPEEWEHFPDDVLVLWPTRHTESILEAVNRLIIIEEIDLSRFSLEYPITLSNVLDDWEDVRAMLFVGANAGGVSAEGRWGVDINNGRWPAEEDVPEDSE